MKALDLRTFPRNQWGGYEIPLSVWSTIPNDDPDDFYVVQISADDAREHSERKRLTDAELAAEYHQERVDMMAERFPRHPGRVSTLHRFATLPHYDEDQP